MVKNIKLIKEQLQAHIKEHGVPNVVQDEEPDMKAYMDSEQYAREFDKAFGNPKEQIDDFIDGLGFSK